MRRWLPVLVLASAQFVMVLDSTVMNVSVSAVVADLDTTVPMLQLAIASYTLIIGTALIGAVLLGGLASGFSSEVANDPRLSPQLLARSRSGNSAGWTSSRSTPRRTVTGRPRYGAKDAQDCSTATTAADRGAEHGPHSAADLTLPLVPARLSPGPQSARVVLAVLPAEEADIP
jgi:hypothetical protein